MTRFYAGVGASEAPQDALELARRIGKVSCDLGWGLSSGDCVGMDRAFYEGAQMSANFNSVENRIYLAWNGVRGRFENHDQGFYNAKIFTDTYPKATEMALAARGSFNGLGPGGQAMHIRNVYQVHGHTLDVPVKAVVFWAIPVGKKGLVKGGTNTAVQLALKAGIKCINLYTDEGLQRALTFLEKYENVDVCPR